MQSIGERLEEARKRKGVTIREAAEFTKIRGEYLNSFEANNFAINLPEIYIRGFLRAYSAYLKISSDKIITDLNAQLLGKTAKRDNREFLGRMELQKPIISEDATGPAGAAPEKDAPVEIEQDSKPPFWKAPFWQNIDKEIALKIGISAVLALLVLVAVIFTISYFVNSSDEPSDVDSYVGTPTAASQSSVVSITLIAKGDVRVKITPKNSTQPIYEGSLAQGEEFDLDVAGTVSVEWDNGANLAIRIGNTDYAMPGDKIMGSINPQKILQRQQEAAGQ